jgi:uncharacterized protein YjbI with pentapeptide repeats
MEVLTVYVRQHSPRQVQQRIRRQLRAKDLAVIRAQNLPMTEEYEDEEQLNISRRKIFNSDKEKPSTDIQSILTVISHRDITKERPEEVLNLESTNLTRANLQGAYLSNACLFGANLRKSNLNAAFLEDSNLVAANLVEANLFAADLARADLTFMFGSDNIGVQKPKSVNLGNAKLYGAILRAALLDRADLQSANLDGADLRGAHLEEVNLQKATLFEADLRGAELTGANLYKA